MIKEDSECAYGDDHLPLGQFFLLEPFVHVVSANGLFRSGDQILVRAFAFFAVLPLTYI